MYSQEVPKGGPIPTTFTYDDEGGKVKLLGNTSEPKGKIKFTKLFNDEGMSIKSFAIKAVFEQEIELVDNQINTVNAFVEFIACTDEQCLPPKEIDLAFNLDKATTAVKNEVSEKSSSKEKKRVIKYFHCSIFLRFCSIVNTMCFSNDTYDC